MKRWKRRAEISGEKDEIEKLWKVAGESIESIWLFRTRYTVPRNVRFRISRKIRATDHLWLHLSTSLRCIFQKFRRNRSFLKRRVISRTSICKRVLVTLGRWYISFKISVYWQNCNKMMR